MGKSTGSVRDVMTPNPIMLRADQTVVDAARSMRDADIGPVVVLDGDEVCGILTDRDIAVRVVAEGMDPSATRIGDVCTRDLATISSDATVDDAMELMRERAIRRVPVVDDGKPVGIVALGDVATERDADEALADISAAPAQD